MGQLADDLRRIIDPQYDIRLLEQRRSTVRADLDRLVKQKAMTPGTGRPPVPPAAQHRSASGSTAPHPSLIERYGGKKRQSLADQYRARREGRQSPPAAGGSAA